ncbi:hypothetical protein CANTEDRAFT_113938 [Yamadazyma tenuis ATCC 10573]|uniref:Uncharacterized protein n=1 Tax=Candida tenuis (strain ATCC 10573 / BCRC 21748 / CBS 615 / JCM 9827 / NBRC 10315 / NRRL Y-1498 / VKM Y-70) TaxID=590646 RepID=G3B409_CANTC|nr:uncharacterized protein CANTEDRAFT_113938 [Yamadazyma tenuis ATCC 10573]EGV63908.1 hypothetical protein CANTEDRAFT_113938 [Yamadazyma tenuis ATCC 10573]
MFRLFRTFLTPSRTIPVKTQESWTRLNQQVPEQNLSEYLSQRPCLGLTLPASQRISAHI